MAACSAEKAFTLRARSARSTSSPFSTPCFSRIARRSGGSDTGVADADLRDAGLGMDRSRGLSEPLMGSSTDDGRDLRAGVEPLGPRVLASMLS